MEDCLLLTSYSLEKLKVIINNKNPSFSCCLLRNESKQYQEKPNLTTIDMNINIREALNHCLKPKADVLKIWIKNKCITLNLITKVGVYSFATMNYFFFLQAVSNNQQDKVFVSIDEVLNNVKQTAIKFKIVLHQQGKSINELLKNNQIWVQFGSAKKQNVLNFEIHSLFLSSSFCNKIPICDSKFDNKFEFIDNIFSTPLGVIPSVNKIYENFGIKGQVGSKASLGEIETIISKLQSYESPPFEKENKLYLCHDMRGGYIEDINFDNNTVQHSKPDNLHYRSYHLDQTEIFNYFSHYNITIPPIHWRIACRTAKTKCLGTFIIEQPVYTQFTLTSYQFALFLVAIAKRCKFDGYLINIEINMANVASLKKWLGYLTQKIHEHIPNSVIIWYDSISQKDGVIRYQNGLSEQNYEFYNLTDGLFTNYWWNQQLLKKTVDLKNGNPKKVYIGNDCFGRNTYEGGMYNMYKAVNKILQYKNELSIALFAPGFTYEDGCLQNRQLFHIHQLSLYKGVKFQEIVADRWKITANGGNGWKAQGQWSVTSFALCTRAAVFKFNPLQKGQAINLKFMVWLMGTPPVNNSPYKIVLQVLDQSNSILYQSQANNFANFKKTTEKQQQCTYDVSITEQLVGLKIFSIKIIQMGQSKVNWAGHFGPRFKKEIVYPLIYEKQRHWINKIPVNHVKIGEPYHTYCNSAVSNHFYFEGIQMQPNYGFLADYDLPHTHTINHPFDTELNYDGFVGGSSLTMKHQVLKLLKIYIPKNLDLKKEYFIQVTVKDTSSVELVFKYISKNQEERIFSAKSVKVQDINKWKRFTFKMMTGLNEVKNDIRSIIDIVSVKQNYSLGQIKIMNVDPSIKKTITCRLEISREYAPTSSYYLNIILQSPVHKRLLVALQNTCAFAYFQESKANLFNISLTKCQQFEIKVVDVDSALGHLVLREVTVSAQQMANLILNGFILV